MPEVQGLDALEDTNPDPNVVEVSLTAGRTAHSFLSGTTAPVYAYNGSIPGPLLRAKVGDRVIVHFKNDLPEPTTIHWHGLRIPDQMDGSPRVHDPVKPGAEFTYDFTVPDAGSYWYHPHVQAPVQVEMGLYAPIVIFDPKNDPTYDAERFLVLDDIRIEKNGKVSPESSMDGMMGGRFGNVLLTNGKPAKEATASAEQGTIERWRIVNSANARTMQIGLEGASFRVIATDGGLLPEPYATKRLVVAIGQRFDGPPRSARHDRCTPCLHDPSSRHRHICSRRRRVSRGFARSPTAAISTCRVGRATRRTLDGSRDRSPPPRRRTLSSPACGGCLSGRGCSRTSSRCASSKVAPITGA